jgi:hypothetical protein
MIIFTKKAGLIFLIILLTIVLIAVVIWIYNKRITLIENKIVPGTAFILFHSTKTNPFVLPPALGISSILLIPSLSNKLNYEKDDFSLPFSNLYFRHLCIATNRHSG